MKVAIYCRLSDEDKNKANPQDDSESIQNQKNLLIKHSLEQGWDIFDIYSDDDYKGSDRNRPEFNRLLRDAESRKFQIVLCKTQSRFTRELEIVEKYIHGVFLEWGVRFIGLVDNADTLVKGNKKSRQINGLINEWYLEDLSESVSAALDTKRERGQYIGAFPLYGYRKSGTDKGRLEIDDAAAATVQRIFQMYNEGYGLSAIASKLNGEAIPNPTWYKVSLGMKCTQKRRAGLGNTWSVNTVRGILRNGMYAGDLIQGRFEKVSYKSRKLRSVPKERWIVSKATHEPIIDRDMWNNTQLQLSQRTKMQKGGTVHLFAGKAFCMECGSALHSNFARGIKYLRCPTGEVAKHRCSGSAIQLREVEKHVLEEINRLVNAYYDEQLLQDMVVLNHTGEAELKVLANAKALQEKALADMKKAALSLYLDKAKGSLPEDHYEMLYQELMAQKEISEQRIRVLDDQISNMNLRIETRKSKEEIIAKYRNFTELSRELVNDFIERIEVAKRNKPGNTVRLKLVWKI